MMMVLGMFVFMLKTIPYQELQYQKEWRHASNNRVGKRPVLQFVGPDTDTITLSGVLVPALTGGTLSMLALEVMAETGRAWPLIEGSGMIYGMYVVSGLTRTKSEFFSDGAPRKVEFTITLKRVDESLFEMFGNMSDQVTQLKDTALKMAGDLFS